jgi:hypothetical protein
MSGVDMIDLVFDGELPNAVLVEAEDGSGNSINVGDWFKREDGYWILRIKTVQPAHSDVVRAAFQRKYDSEAGCYEAYCEMLFEYFQAGTELAPAAESYPHGSPLHKEVFMALESFSGGDTFEDGVRGLIRELKEARALLAGGEV